MLTRYSALAFSLLVSCIQIGAGNDTWVDTEKPVTVGVQDLGTLGSDGMTCTADASSDPTCTKTWSDTVIESLQQSVWDEKAQEISDSSSRLVWKATREYMSNKVLVEDIYAQAKDRCKNMHPRCTAWATKGECDTNPGFMRQQCGPACQACDQLLDFAVRCNLDRDAPTFFNKGDVNRMFRHILENPIYQQYEPIVHSRPGGDSTDPNVLDGPWVVTVENFTSPQECERLIEVSEDVGFKPSYGAMGQRDKDGRRERIQTEFRTSKSAYCLQACDLDTNIQTLTGRMENITGAPHSHLQYLHFMKYESSELYKLHSDYAKEHREQLHGVRLLTFLVYLDDVEDGGGTNFPQLNITVQPKRGRALLWPNVLDEDPNAEEKRTQHQSLPVNKGVKRITTTYIYQRDFKKPYVRHCII